jgi:hypothetical protein
MKNFFYKILGALIVFVGNSVGRIVHSFRGCKGFYKHEIGDKGKLKRRVCKRCGKRWDRQNGFWKFMGRYNLKGVRK